MFGKANRGLDAGPPRKHVAIRKQCLIDSDILRLGIEFAVGGDAYAILFCFLSLFDDYFSGHKTAPIGRKHRNNANLSCVGVTTLVSERSDYLLF
jgi:hypothetical protein